MSVDILLSKRDDNMIVICMYMGYGKHFFLLYNMQEYYNTIMLQGRTQDFSRGVSCSSKRYHAQSAWRNFAKPRPLISEKRPWMEAI